MQIQNKRKDIVTHESCDVAELIRFQVTDGKIILPARSYNGRCYYIKKGLIKQAIEHKVFEKLLKRPLSEEEKGFLSSYEC